MRLVDILARDLKFWPGDEDFTWQDYDREIRFSKSAWCNFPASELAEDNTRPHGGSDPDSGVTRAEWQAAVDALNAPKVVEWPSLGETVEVIKGPAEWDCDQRAMIGIEGKVRSVFKNDCDQKIVAIELSSGECKCFIVECIKPAITAEQVAAEEREKAIEEMVAVSPLLDKGWSRKVCAALYDNDYRKQVAK